MKRTRLRSPEVIVGLFAAVIQVINLLPLRGPFIFADELGYVAAARYFGPGYPEIQMQSGFFHAGYGLLLAPLTAIFPEPERFYRAAVGINGLMVVAAAVLATRLIRRLYQLSDGQAILAGALFAVSTSAMVSASVVWTESTLILLTVLIAAAAARLAEQHRVIDAVGLTVLGVFAYFVHPRAIAMTVSVACLWVLLGWYRRRWLRSAIAIGVMILGFVAVRQVHELTADRLFAASALSGSNSSFRYRIEESILGSPAAWSLGVIGLAWYQLVASVGLVAIAWAEWGTSAMQFVRRTRPSPSARVVVGTLLLGATVSTCLVSATIATGDQPRLDHAIYGRYLDHMAPLGMAVAAALVLRRASAVSGPLAAGAFAIPALGLGITAWWGADHFLSNAVQRVNIPVHATLSRWVDDPRPSVVASFVFLAVVGLLVGARRWPGPTIVVTVVGLGALGVATVRHEVHPQSRATMANREMASEVEALAGGGPVMIAEPFTFLNLYGGQFWADDTSFVLATECPAQATEFVIAPIDDPRYLDYRILFTDERSERQLLEVSPVGGPASWAISTSVSAPAGPVPAGSTVPITITVTNTDTEPLDVPGLGPRTVTLAYRFIDADTHPYTTSPVGTGWNGRLEPGSSVTIEAEAVAEREGAALAPGRYEIVADLWVSGIGWLNEVGCPGGLPGGVGVDVAASE